MRRVGKAEIITPDALFLFDGKPHELALYEKLAGRLLAALTQAAPDSWQQILHYLAGTAWIDAQGEETKP